METGMDSFISEIEKEVRICGQRMREARCGEGDIGVKGKADFVTKYDRMNQEYLAERLPRLLPGSVFVGEEEDIHASIAEGFAFIVDPIDGTTNFIRDYQASALSVGVTKDGAPYAGVVYNPYLDEMFTAQIGKGAYLNGQPIHVSDRDLGNSIVVFGTALYYRDLADEVFSMAKRYFDKSLDIRRSGSAAIDLCNVAAGRTEIFFESKLSPWDYAAGLVIVSEAGGAVVDYEKKRPSLSEKSAIFAANHRILDAIDDIRNP